MAEFLNSNIKYLRTCKNISQQSLADEVGLDRSTISRIENNEIETTIDNAIKIANVFNVSLIDLINKDLTIEQNEKKIDELEILFSKSKNILTEDDKQTIRFIIEKARKKVDKQLDGE